MEFKEQIESLLNSLKSIGYDRRKVERELGYEVNYIDQVLSKGGNKKFLSNLQRFHVAKNNKDIANDSTKDQKIAALMAAIKILTLELIQIKHKQTGESVASISIQLERMMQSEAKRHEDESS